MVKRIGFILLIVGGSVWAEPLTLEQRLSKVEAQASLVTDFQQQLSEMRDQLLQVNGHVEQLGHSLDEKTSENAVLKASLVELNKTIQDLTKTVKDLQDNPEKTAGALTVQVASSNDDIQDAGKKLQFDDQKAYDSAYQWVGQNDYKHAITAFKNFIKEHPGSHHLSAAHYWLGELYMIQNEPNKAMTEFKWLLLNSPKSLYTPEAGFKMGMIYKTQGDLENAKTVFNKVITDYPKSKAATNARQKLKLMK